MEDSELTDDTLEEDKLDMDEDDTEDVDEDERDELRSIFFSSTTPFLRVEKNSPPNLLDRTRESSDL